MANHLKLVFHGYVEERKSTNLYVVRYMLGKRDPRPLTFSRWCQVAPTYKWGVWSDEAQKAGCTQLAWTILFAYLIKQTDLTDSRQTADLVTDDLVAKFVKRHVSKFPEIWWLSGKSIAKFLANSNQNPQSNRSIPIPNS